MAVHNDPDVLPEAVGSVLAQTLGDWELILIDDGSTDRTPEVIEDFRDGRIRVVRNPENEGLTRSLRRGVRMARGRFIARLDADDVAKPERLRRQVDYLEGHPEVSILGGACVHVGETGRPRGLWRPPVTDLEIRWVSLLTNPFVHSTVMLRKEILDRHGLNYDEAFETTQDYDLWTRLLEHGQGANLREALIWYRVRGGITEKRRDQQLWNTEKIAARTIGRELPGFSLEAWQTGSLRHFFHERPTAAVREDGDWRTAERVYRELLDAFAGRHRGRPGLARVQRRFVVDVVRTAIRLGLPRGWAGACAGAMNRCPNGLFWVGAHYVQEAARRFGWPIRRPFLGPPRFKKGLRAPAS
jgi:glycosyltransferase involved in cell wall biosynthesis